MITKYKAQTGFVMLTSLVFLMVLTILAITAVRRATQDEGIANNLRGQNLAFQAAETALRFCQKEIEVTGAGSELGTGVVQTVNGVPVNIYPGLPGSPMPNLWQTRSNWTTKAFTLPANTVPDVSAQPECMIEEWKKLNEGFGMTEGGNAGSGTGKAYLITARGQGVTAKTVIWLQVEWYLGSGA